MIATAIDRYAQGASVPLRALEGLTRDDLIAKPIAGTWSIQQIVMHLMDSDLIGSDRMKRIIAEDRPLLVGYNEVKFNEHLHYEELDVRRAAEIFQFNRELTADILRRLRPETFDRVGVHTEVGLITLLDSVKKYADHLDGHMNHLRRKRELLGKTLV